MIRLFSPDDGKPPPLRVWMQLTCDTCRLTQQTFENDDYIADRRAASQSGWRFSGDGKQYGPCCA